MLFTQMDRARQYCVTLHTMQLASIRISSGRKVKASPARSLETALTPLLLSQAFPIKPGWSTDTTSERLQDACSS